MTRLDRAALSVVAGAALLLAAVVFSESLFPLGVTCTNRPDCHTIGPRGNLSFAFSRPVLPAEAAAALQIEPPAAGRWIWQDSQHGMWTAGQSLAPGTILRFSFQSVPAGENGERLDGGRTWDAAVRKPQILYLSARNGYNLMRLDPQNPDRPFQLTHLDNRIYDYQVSPDGEVILLAVMNAEKGIDLWTLGRDGGETSVLLNCGKDRCTTPHWQSGMDEISYTREQAGIGPNEVYGAPRPWLVNPVSGATRQLFSDAQEIGYDATISPTGRWVSIWNGVQGGIEIFDLQTEKSKLISSVEGNAGSWSPDGKYLAHTISGAGTNGYRSYIQILTAESGELQTLETPTLDSADVNVKNPVWNPDGKSLAVTVQKAGSSSNGDLWILDAEAGRAHPVAVGEEYLRGLYAWSPDGAALLYKSDRMSSMSEKGVLAVWNLKGDGAVVDLAEGINFPAWLP